MIAQHDVCQGIKSEDRGEGLHPSADSVFPEAEVGSRFAIKTDQERPANAELHTVADANLVGLEPFRSFGRMQQNGGE